MIDTNGKTIISSTPSETMDAKRLHLMFNASNPIDFHKHTFFIFVDGNIATIYTSSSCNLTDDNVIYYGYVDPHYSLKILPCGIDIEIISFEIEPRGDYQYLNDPITIEHPIHIRADSQGYTFEYDQQTFNIRNVLKFNHYVDGVIEFIGYLRNEKILIIENNL